MASIVTPTPTIQVPNKETATKEKDSIATNDVDLTKHPSGIVPTLQ